MSFQIFSQTLTEREIYQRCATRLLRWTPSDNDPFVLQITSGSMTGPTACKSLLELASFESTTGLLPSYNSIPVKKEMAVKVLASMNDLHSSWLTLKSFKTENSCFAISTEAAFDPLEPALFFTRSLFDSRYKYSSVTTSTDNLRAVRTVDTPVKSIFHPIIERIDNFPVGFKLVGNGNLLGVVKGQNPVVTLYPYTLAPGETARPASLLNQDVLKNQGGGILGSQMYLLNNIPKSDIYANLLQMPRAWGKWVYKDLLCRDLPVVYEADAKPFTVCSDSTVCGIQPKSTEVNQVLPFRQSKSCTQCHASMDQMLGVIRNYRSFNSGSCRFNDPKVINVMALAKQPPSLPAASSSWGYIEDKDFWKRPSEGLLYFRSYNGTLINKKVNSLAELGTALAQTDDLYICAAKRYYYYFTGIDVPLTPMTDANVELLPADQKFYRKRVVELGKKLRSLNVGDFNQNPMSLIKAIFDLPEYKKKDFNMIENTVVK